MKSKKIKRNAVQCLVCDTVIESRYDHHWVRCECPPDSDTWVYVDGGEFYARRGSARSAKYRDLIEYYA